MKNIHVIHFVESNNRHEWLENLISLLDAKGFSQTLVSIEPPGSISSYLLEKFPQVHVNRTRKYRLNTVTGVRELIKSRKKNSVNIVFTLGHPAAFIAGITTYFVNMDFVLSHMHQPRYFQLMKPKWKGILHSTFYRFYLRRASLIHSLSQEVENILIKYGINRHKIFPVNIGVSFDKIYRKLNDTKFDLVLPEGSPKILMVGRLAPEKNYEIALKGFAEFLKNNPQALLLVAGIGPMKQQLSNLTQYLQLTQSVHFFGHVENIPKLMTEVDVLLHLATTESYGQIYIEAVLSGLPVVCTPTGIAIDLMEEKSEYIFASRNDSEHEISANLQYCLTNFKHPTFEKSDQFLLHYQHDEKYVQERIADSFLKLSEKF